MIAVAIYAAAHDVMGQRWWIRWWTLVITTAVGAMTAARISRPLSTITNRSSITSTGRWLEPNDARAVGVHFIRAETLRIRVGSGDRALQVGDLAKVPLAIVGAKDDTDDRLGQSSRRGPGALNLNAVVAAHRGLAAPFRAPTLVVLTIGADDARAAYPDRHRGDGSPLPKLCVSYALLRSALSRLPSGALPYTGGIRRNKVQATALWSR